MEKYYIPIPGYEDKYSISNYGTVLNKETNQELSPQIKYKNTPNEYYTVIINYNGKIRKIPIHKLMALSFNLPGEGKYIIHIDGNNKNNELPNLKLSNLQNRNTQKHIKKYIVSLSTFKPIGLIHGINYDYMINNEGIVINKNNIRLSPIKCSDGYDYIRLYNNGTYIKIRIDRLIGKVFLENGEEYFNNPNYVLKYNFIGDRKNYFWEQKNL